MADVCETSISSKMGILHLVLYSDNGEYPNMKRATWEFYKRYWPSIRTVYYRFDPSINQDYKWISDHEIAFRGKESYEPGILIKTMKALRLLFAPERYQFVFRSNISTIVNFSLLLPLLQNIKQPFFGGAGVSKISWVPEDNKIFGSVFPTGTCIVMSVDIAKFLLDNEDVLEYDVPDDVAIGRLMSRLRPDTPCTMVGSGLFMMDKKEVPLSDEDLRHACYYRNWHPDRREDVRKMVVVVQQLLRKFHTS